MSIDKQHVLRAIADIHAHGPLSSDRKRVADQAYRHFRDRLMAWVLFDEPEPDGPAEDHKRRFLGRQARLWAARRWATGR